MGMYTASVYPQQLLKYFSDVMEYVLLIMFQGRQSVQSGVREEGAR